MLLRLSRASGIDGLAGMAESSPLTGGHGTTYCASTEQATDSQRCGGGPTSDAAVSGEGVRLLRPLLWASKAQLQSLLRESGIGWVEDPTNADTTFARNFIRQLPGMQPLGAQMALRTTDRSTADGALHDDSRGWLPEAAIDAGGDRNAADAPRTQGDSTAADLLQVAAACGDASETWVRAAADVLEACVRPLPGVDGRLSGRGCLVDLGQLSKTPLPVIRRALSAIMQVAARQLCCVPQ